MSTQDQPAEFSVAQNADGTTTGSMKLSEMSLEQLMLVAQALQRKDDELRVQRKQLRHLIDLKVQAKQVADDNEQIARMQALRDGLAQG